MKQETNRQKQAAATKTKIFSCAIDLFSRKAYENISVNEICKAAGVSVGAFYHHFSNKESILNEGYRMFDESIELMWEQSHRAPGIEAVRFLVHSQLKSMENMGAYGAGQYFKNQLTAEERYVLDKNRFFYRKIFENIVFEIKRGCLSGDAHVITGDILGVCRGTIYDWSLNSGSYGLVENGLRFLEMIFLYYCGKREED